MSFIFRDVLQTFSTVVFLKGASGALFYFHHAYILLGPGIDVTENQLVSKLFQPNGSCFQFLYPHLKSFFLVVWLAH